MNKILKYIFISMLTTLLFVVDGSMCCAQKTHSKQQRTLVTRTMALKVARKIQSDKRSLFGRSVFNRANDIRTLLESEKILSSIEQHLDYVENFLVEILYYYGTGDGGYIALKSYGFTPQEYEIAQKIYDKKFERQRLEQEKEERESIRLEQALYDKWMKEGVPDDVKYKSDYKPAEFSVNAQSVAWYLNRLGLRNTSIYTRYDVVINSDGKMNIFPNDELAEYCQLKLKTAPIYEFKNLEKRIYVPSKYTFKLVETRENAFSDKIVKIKWNNGKWNISDSNDIEKEIGSRTYYSIKNDLLYVLNNLKELQDVKKKKHIILVTAYMNCMIKCYIDEKCIGIDDLRNHYEIKVIE